MSIPKPVQALFKWTPSGLGIFLTAHFALAQDVFQAVVAAFLTGLTSLWVKFSDGFMQEAEKQAEQRGGGFARWLFGLFDILIAELRKWISELWWKLTADFEGKYYYRLGLICRNFQAQGLEADRERVLKLREVYVDVRISPKMLSKISPNLLKRFDDRERNLHGGVPIGDFLALLKKDKDTEFRQLVILGAPGSGKTTLMRYLSLMYANRTPYKLHPKAPQFIPVLLFLRDEYRKILDNPVLLEDFLPQWIEGLQKTNPLKSPPGWFAKQLRHQRCLVLLDGLDEVADEVERQQIRDWVDEQMREYPETPFILTSRPAGYRDKAELKQDVMVLEVEELDDDQIHQFVRNWFLALEAKGQGGEVDLGVEEDANRQANQLIAEIEQQSALKEMARNPLLLTMISTVYRRRLSLPLNQVELYQEICQVLLEKRQRAKGIPDVLTAAQKQSILQPLALAITQRNTLNFTETDDSIYSLLSEKLATLPNNPYTPKTFLKQLRDVDALIAKDKENDFEFAHRSFQEYLSATEIKDTGQEAILLNVLKTPDALKWWENTIKLYAAQTEVSNIISTVLAQPTFETLRIAVDCWQLGRSQPEVQQALINEISKPLDILDEPLFHAARERQPRYFKLAYYLKTEQWREADYETYRVMRHIGDRAQKGYLSVEDIQTFPCKDLRIVDKLWLEYSGGKFGFSVQKQIYVECGATLNGKYPGDMIWNDFVDRVGWRKSGNYVNYENLQANPHNSPVGEFPWEFPLGLGLWLGLVRGVSLLSSRLVNCSR